MLPDADVTTLGFEVTGSDEPLSRLEGKCGELVSVGVGGVLTMIGAMSPGGGVEGAEVVFIGWIFAVRGRSGEEVVESVWDDCLSGNIAPILEATLPRLLSAIVFFSCDDRLTPPPPGCRSGLVFGLGPRRIKAFLIRAPGDGDRL